MFICGFKCLSAYLRIGRKPFGVILFEASVPVSSKARPWPISQPVDTHHLHVPICGIGRGQIAYGAA